MKLWLIQLKVRHLVAVEAAIGLTYLVTTALGQPAPAEPEPVLAPEDAPPSEPPRTAPSDDAPAPEPAPAEPTPKPEAAPDPGRGQQAPPESTEGTSQERPSQAGSSESKPKPPPTQKPTSETNRGATEVDRPGAGARREPAASGRTQHVLRYTLERIRVRGNQRTKTRVVLRYLPFVPGDLIDVDNPEIRLARYRLLGTGFFRDVQFSLEKGSGRGLVVLVVDVVERNTVVVNDVWMGIAADADNEGNARPLTAYAGIDVAETNLLGTGVTLGGAMAVAQDQFALRALFLDPGFLGSPWMTSATFLYNDARDFFGNADVRYSDPGQLDQRTEHAVARYERIGGALGVGRDLSSATQMWLHYRLENVDASYPLQASHQVGVDNIEPIDFDIIRGQSLLSTLRTTLQFDTRDHPFLPTRGWFLTATGEVGLSPFGSDYSYQRSDVHASHWWELPWRHVLRLELFGGAISGDAPFFEQYYVGDFSDFLPSRVLGVNFDRRPPPNFLGTQIVEVRYGDYAAKLGAEYRLPLYRGHRSIFGIDLFASAGLYSVFSDRHVKSPVPGYTGAARIPVDLTANVGFRMDTAAGGFVFTFSNVLYFIPVGTEGPAGD